MKLKQFMIALLMLALAAPVLAGPFGPHIERMATEGKGNFAGGRFAKSFERVIDGKVQTYAHVFIEAEHAAIQALLALGAEINTVTDSGIMTAVVPVAKLHAIGAVAGVKKVTAGQAVKKFMNLSAGPNGVNLPDTKFPRTANTGAGVIVGVIDTGIDIEHPDFIDQAGTRILSIWDHTLDPGDVGNSAATPAGFNYGTEWIREQINKGYAGCPHRDRDGHGSHVAGTAAGNGSAASHGGPYTGLAPEAELLIVKFDFDNEKGRNSDTAILDGINWIFQKAAEAGKPCVINMSLGSDYGPHDGSTAEERGIDDLTGAGKIVVVAAGNAGTSYGGIAFSSWGAPIHGDGNVSTKKDIVIETSPDYTPDTAGSADDYLFFDLWYPGTDRCRVQITTPSGATYPAETTGIYNNLWVTDGQSGGFATPEGTIYVANVSGAASFWGTDNGDNNLYIEISDASGTNPAPGQWVIEIIPLSGTGEYQAWQGYSPSMARSYFWYDSGADHSWGIPDDPSLSDNAMTIGNPATAFSAISVGAYQTKAQWPARKYKDWTKPDQGFSYIDMAYGDPPITYYDTFYMHDIAFFSSRGPSRDGRVQPFIAAPGVGIVASLSQTVLNDPYESYFRAMNRVEYEGYYATLQGTSMAAPHATGSIALLLEAAANRGISATPDDVKSYLKAGAYKDVLTDLDPQDLESANGDWGYGKIDVASSLLAMDPSDLRIVTTSLAEGTVGAEYSQTLVGAGGVSPYTWGIVSGSLPAGLSLEPETGVITGVPTAAGTANLEIGVTDAVGSKAFISLSISVGAAGSSPVVENCVPGSGRRGQRLTVTVNGDDFQAGAEVNFGPGIIVQTSNFVSATVIECRIKIEKKAAVGARDVTVTNPDTRSGSLAGGFEVVR